MIFGKALKNPFKKGACSRFFMSILMLGSLSSAMVMEKNENEPNEEKSISVLPQGEDALCKFENRLSDNNGLEGKLTFEAKYPDKDKTTYSELSVSDAAFAIYKKDDFLFHVDGSLSYNAVTLPLLIHLSSDDSYLSLLGARYAYRTSDFESLFDSIISIFGKDSIEIPSSFYSWMDKLIENGQKETDESLDADFSSESIATDSYLFSWSFPSAMEGKIYFETDGRYGLRKIYGNELKIDEFVFSFSLLVSNDDVDYSTLSSLRPSDSSSYTQIVDSMGLVKKAVELTRSKKAGLSFQANLTNQTNFSKEKGKEIEEEFDLSGSFSFDLNEMKMNGDILASGYGINDEKGSKTLSFVSRKEAADGWKAFVKYNNVMDLAMDSATFENVLAIFEDDISSFGSADSILSFLTDSDAIKDIKNGRYDTAISAISSIATSEDKIVASLKLADFGFGDDSSLALTLDANDGGITKAVFENIVVRTANFSELVITLTDYTEKTCDEASYFELDGLPTFASQMKNIFQKKRVNLSFSANVLDSQGLGYPEISGNVYFDLNEGMKKGSGDVTLKHKVEDGSTKNNHVLVDVTGLEDTDVTRFHYNDGDSNDEGMRGQMSIKDLNSIIALAVGLYNDNDPRFAKFFDPIRMALMSNVVGALTANRYGPFIATNVMKSASISADKCVFTMDAASFGLEEGSTFDIVLNFVASELVSLEIKGLKYEDNTINAVITLIGTSFDDSKLSVVTDFTDSNHFKFDGVDKLLEAALNESKRETYRLYSDSVKVSLNIFSISMDLKLDFHIYVKGEVVKVYGVVSNISVYVVSRHYNIGYLNNKRTSTLYYDNIDTDKTNETGVETALADQKGYLYISSYNSYKYWGKEKTATDDVVKYSTDQLTGSKTIAHMVLYDILGLDLESYLDDLTNTKETSKAYENLLTQYEYVADNSNHPTWKVGINLGALANNSILKSLSIELNGGDYGGASEGYLSSLTIPEQQILSTGSLIKFTATAKGTINNSAPGSDYWSSVSSSWNSFMSANRSKDCTSYS